MEPLEEEDDGTCWEVLVDRPVVHLQGGVAPVPGESNQVVLAVVHRRGQLSDADVHRPDVEGHADLPLLLEGTQKKKPRVNRADQTASTATVQRVHLTYVCVAIN